MGFGIMLDLDFKSALLTLSHGIVRWSIVGVERHQMPTSSSRQVISVECRGRGNLD